MCYSAALLYREKPAHVTIMEGEIYATALRERKGKKNAHYPNQIS